MRYLENLVEVVKELWHNPKAFFAKLEKEKSLKPAVIYFLVLVFISTIFRSLSDVIIQPQVSLFLSGLLKVPYQAPNITIDIAFYHVIFSTLSVTLIAGPLYALISSIVLHLWIKLWRGKGSFKDTLRLYVYAITSSFLTSWIPFLSVLGWIHTGHLFIVGSQEIHKLSKRKAQICFGVPLAILLIITIWGIIATFSLLQSESLG